MSELTIRQATTRKQIKEIQSLRYRVYCAELGWIDSEKYNNDGLEVDEYDEHSIHFGAYFKGKLVGTVRLILDRMGLPTYNLENIDRSKFRTDSNAEISRLIILRNKAYSSNKLLLSLIKNVYHYGKYNLNIENWFCILDVKLYKLVRLVGIRVAPLSEKFHYMGSDSIPAIISRLEMDKYLSVDHSELYAFFNSDLAVIK